MSTGSDTFGKTSATSNKNILVTEDEFNGTRTYELVKTGWSQPIVRMKPENAGITVDSIAMYPYIIISKNIASIYMTIETFGESGGLTGTSLSEEFTKMIALCDSERLEISFMNPPINNSERTSSFGQSYMTYKYTYSSPISKDECEKICKFFDQKKTIKAALYTKNNSALKITTNSESEKNCNISSLLNYVTTEFPDISFINPINKTFIIK